MSASILTELEMYIRSGDLPRATIVELNELLMLQRNAALGDLFDKYLVEVALAQVHKVNNAQACCGRCANAIQRGDRYHVGVVLAPIDETGFLICDDCGLDAAWTEARERRTWPYGARRAQVGAAAKKALAEPVPPDRTANGSGRGRA